MVRSQLPKLLVAATLAAGAPGFASARIQCDGAYQIVKGRPLATPYCQDENLATVARSYGMRGVTGDAMRHSPSKKGEVCRFIGHDLRVREACLNYRDDGFGPSLRF